LGKKSKDYPNEPKSAEVKKLKAHIRKLDKDIAKLKSELRTYDKAFQKNITFLKNQTKRFSVEELIEGAKIELTLEEIGQDKEESSKEVEKDCFQCEEGVMKMIVVPGNRYFYKCTHCENRTIVKILINDASKEN
jgi:hypothetical protein